MPRIARCLHRRHRFTREHARWNGSHSLSRSVAVVGAIALVVKGWDVRLVLLSAALVIAAAAGDVPVVVREFLATFSNEKFVVPICSAMGFAYVLRHTGCERHLVLLLVKPLRYVRVAARAGRGRGRVPGEHPGHQPDEHRGVHRARWWCR